MSERVEKTVNVVSERAARPVSVARLAVLLVLVASCTRRHPAPGDAAPPGSLPPGATPVAPAPTAPPAAPIVLSPPAAAPFGAPTSFAALAKAADPGVVTLISRTEAQTRSGRRRLVSEGLGSGFVFDKTGLILTNQHVVEGSTEVSVRLAGGHEAPARIVGGDKLTDVAVVRIEAGELHALALGDSDGLEVGDWVVAIGNPFGLSHTVSAGILSARGRTRADAPGLDENGYFNFLQTDAAINPGNSGGPLLNLRGEVVGINAAIRANANNIGFAIPINMVKELLPILLRDGKITRSALGAYVGSVSEDEAARLKRPDRRGAWIKGVIPGQAADRAGLAVDDLVLAVDGRAIADADELRWVASLAGVGKLVTLRVQRGDRAFDLRVTLGAQPEPSPDDEEPPPQRRRLVPIP